MLNRLIAAATLLLLASCDSPVGSGGDAPIRAQADAQVLSLTNVSARSVHYGVFERVDEGTIFWGRCTPANEECPTLAPGETVRIAYAEITRYDAGDQEAIVYWWTTEPQPGGGYGIRRQGDVVVRL